jgi:hypothetical protein
MSEQDTTPTLDDDEGLDMLDREPDDFEDEDFDDGDVDLDDEPLPFEDDILLQEFVPDEVGGNGDLVFEDEDSLLGATPMASPVAMPEERLARLEQTARVLAEQEEAREQKRVHRKVKASTTGAAGAAFVPILLQLVGALDLPPNLAATVTAGASALGALLAGYLTPEREQPVTATPAAQDLLAETAALQHTASSGAHHRRRRRTRRRTRARTS